MPNLTISRGTASEAELNTVFEGLRAHNEARVGDPGYSPLHVLLRDDEGEVRGGLAGDVYLGWLFVRYLWVAEEHRGGGYGECLLREAEDEARSRGCHAIWLDTFSFQAPGFYRRLGFQEFGRLDDYPAGHARHFLWKPLGR
ncbi:MAG TPA: GNAT family N-acetyltransferase [Longimicrobium sp.]|jgi:GNAT superfamily N-acetyltransferase